MVKAMSSNGKKGAVTWLLGFLTLFSIFNAFNAIIQLNGSSTTAYFQIFGLTLGSLNVEAYFWISIIATFGLFGATSFSIYLGLPTDPQVFQRLSKVEEILALNSNMLENTQVGFFRRLEENEKAGDEIFRKININMDDMKKENSANLTKQENVLLKMDEENKKTGDTIKKQTKELANLKKKIDKFGKEKAPKPKLTGQTKLEMHKNISPPLAAKLKEMKINKISELLVADSTLIAEKASELVENISNIQAQAQLMMVPSIDEKQAEMLVKVGVTSRRELGNQDPVQLYRGIIGIAKTYVGQGKISPRKIPTIEDVSSWIRQARL
jgi:hypothetical protein